VSATGSPQQTDRSFRFGPFELSERDGELRKNGIRIKLQEQPFRVLVELVANAGKVVSREELQQRLWSQDTFVDFDTGLNTAIRKIRLALDDDAEHPHYLETLARRGYRFIAQVVEAPPAPNSSAALAAGTRLPDSIPILVSQISLHSPPQVASKSHSDSSPAGLLPEKLRASPAKASQAEHSARWKWVATGAVAALLVAAAFWGTRPPADAVVESVTQITDDGQAKGVFDSLQSDGSRLYFNEGRRGDLHIAQVAVTGGAISIIPTPLVDAQPGGVARDGSFLSVLQGGAAPPGHPVWKVPLPAGEPVRIGNLKGQDTSVTPDGRIMVGYEGDLFIVDADGSNLRKLVSGMDGWVGNPAMSSDLKQIAFTFYPHGGGASIYLVNSDGSDSREVAASPDLFCCSQWTADDRYLLFETRAKIVQEIWYMPVRRSWWQPRVPPRKLAALPLSLHDPMPNPRDPKTVFALGNKERGELVRLDLKTKKFGPFLPGISATDVVFSKDGQWIAYNAFPEMTLWRSRVDGSDRLQLSFEMAGEEKSFSTDGKSVAFSPSGKPMSLINIEGGEARPITQDKGASFLDYSPDGRQIAFTTPGAYNVMDVATGQRISIPAQGDLWGGRWIGDNKLVAMLASRSGFKLLDLKSHTWSDWAIDPATNSISRWGVSPDHQYLYYATSGVDPQLMRVRIGENRAESVISLKDFRFAMLVQWVGSDLRINFVPDGSPLLLRDRGSDEIYALTIRWP
jgi:DNA-binding winged helix-turn-helix (wHTH) protein